MPELPCKVIRMQCRHTLLSTLIVAISFTFQLTFQLTFQASQAFGEQEPWIDFPSSGLIDSRELELNAAATAPIYYESDALPTPFAAPPAKGVQVGKFTIVPYGTIWADSVYATSRAVPGRFALWIASEEDQGEASYELDARRSRVGVDVLGPTISCYDSGARLEVDFLGNFVTDNQPDVRLRHAYWEAKNEEARFLVGQTWDVVSPLLPNTVNFSVSWAAGNLGFRRTQIRAEKYILLGSGATWTLQGALAQNIIQDLANGFSSDGVTREAGDWPMLQGRSAVTFDNIQAGAQTMTLGMSGHYGETGFDFAKGHPANPALGPEDDVRIETWSINFDAKIPLTEKLSFQGELFRGANLSNLFGGIGQGVCPCLRVPIDSIGGWSEIRYVVNPKIATHVGYSIDDPDDKDSLIGRTKNQVFYTNLFYKVTEDLTTGLEVSTWRTDYHNRSGETGFKPVAGPTEPGKAVLFDVTLRYVF